MRSSSTSVGRRRSFPYRPILLVPPAAELSRLSFLPPRGAPAARAPPRRSLSRSTPSRLRFASLVSRHHHASTPSSSTTNSHANSHANSNSPQPSRYQKALDDTKAAVTLHPATPTPPAPGALALTRQHHTKEKTTSPLSPTACHRTGILYRSAGRDREIL